MKILIAGGTGFLGQHLTRALLLAGHEVLLLTRNTAKALEPQPFKVAIWPLQTPEEKLLVHNCEVVINLAGESLAGGRWSEERKLSIKRSRGEYTKELIDSVRESTQLKLFISASAVGFYGDRKTEVLTEESPPGEGFLADVCREWEAALSSYNKPGLRKVLLRTGVVLHRTGGMLKEIEPLYRSWVGGPLGNGEQYLSWIHLDDWVAAVMHCLNNEKVHGSVNLVAPEPVTNRSFSVTYSKLFRQPWQLPAPKLALKTALGEMSSMLLDSQNVRPEKLLATHFKFKHQHLSEALFDIYDYEAQGRQVHEYFTTECWVPASLAQVFAFFSSEKNLEKITPPAMNFRVVKKSTSDIIKGTLIFYDLKVRGLPMKWTTEITDWRPPHSFTDMQLNGPYSRWHHTHTFHEIGDWTLMRDTIHYRLPMGFFGRAGLPIVKKDVENIFSFREQTIKELFV